MKKTPRYYQPSPGQWRSTLFDMSTSGLLRFQLLSNPAQFHEIQSGHRAKQAAEHNHHNAVH